MAVAHAEAPDRCLVDLAALPVADADGGDPPPVRRPGRRAPRPAGRDPATAGSRACVRDVDEVDVGPPAEVRVAVPVRRRTRSVAHPATSAGPRRGVAPRQQLGVARLAASTSHRSLEPVVDEPGAVELVARACRSAACRAAAGPPACAPASSPARWRSAPLTTHSRRPSGDQASPRRPSADRSAGAPRRRRRTGGARPACRPPSEPRPCPAWHRRRRPAARRRGPTGRRASDRPGSSAARCRSCSRRSAGGRAGAIGGAIQSELR